MEKGKGRNTQAGFAGADVQVRAADQLVAIFTTIKRAAEGKH